LQWLWRKYKICLDNSLRSLASNFSVEYCSGCGENVKYDKKRIAHNTRLCKIVNKNNKLTNGKYEPNRRWQEK
jgi:hypothetical protein